MRVWVFAVAVGLCALLCVPSPAFATVVREQSLEQMFTRAALVVRGRVGVVEARWDEGRRLIHTHARVYVSESLKGAAPPVLWVRQPGGSLDGVTVSVEGAARFTSGEDVVLFLERAPDAGAVFVVSGLAAGKVALLAEGAVRRLEGLVLYRTGAATPQVVEPPAQEWLGPAESFLTRLRNLGKPAEGAR